MTKRRPPVSGGGPAPTAEHEAGDRPDHEDVGAEEAQQPAQVGEMEAGVAGQADDPGSEASGVYYVIPYEYSSADQYRKYVDAYVIPQVKGWMKEGVLNRYSLYLNRYPVGDPWDSLFIYEYRDRESFGKREETIAKVRNDLKNDSVWKHWSDIKATIRSESENTIMEEVTPRPSAPHPEPKGSH